MNYLKDRDVVSPLAFFTVLNSRSSTFYTDYHLKLKSVLQLNPELSSEERRIEFLTFPKAFWAKVNAPV